MSLWIAVIPPKQAFEAIVGAVSQYSEYLDTRISENTLHMPLMEISAIPTEKPLRQAFHQTLRILSVGKEGDAMSLRVFLQTTPSLMTLLESLQKHLDKQNISATYPQDFTPNIHLGTFATIPAFGIINTPLALTFSVQKLHIIQTEPYEVLGTIDVIS